MKIAILLLVAVLATSAMATWSSCGDGTLSLSNVVINPEPIVRGKNVSFTVSGTLSEEVTGGTVALSVTYLGVNVFSHSYDICAQAEFPCPISAGPYSASQSLPFPSFPPKGTYKGQLKMTDNTGKLIACIAFSESVEVEAPQKLVHDADFIAEINEKANGLWVAAPSKKFHGMTLADARKLLGAKLDGPKPRKSARSLPIGSIPASFTWQGDQCLGAIRDQQQCGSCWAFSATEALADRFCIKSKGAVKVVLSPEDLVSCDRSDSGCDGGYLTSAWNYLVNSGSVTEQCFPYSAGSGTAPACRSTCANGQPWTKYKAAKGTVVQPSSVSAIQTEIMANGPVQAAFTVYADFFNYKSGVYSHVSGAEEGGHAIKIVGWGVSSANVPYWIVANSWGTSWGMNGFFEIKRGNDECGIESNVIAGIAAV